LYQAGALVLPNGSLAEICVSHGVEDADKIIGIREKIASSAV
jgi:hypothetical protein